MTPFTEKIDGLHAFLSNQDDIILGLIQGEERTVLDLNRESQLFDLGEDANSREIRPRYTPYTIQIKRLKGQPIDRVTLKDTGDFYRSFDIVYTADAFEILALDSKTQKIVAKYGYEVLGLSDDSLQFVIDAIMRGGLIQELGKSIL